MWDLISLIGFMLGFAICAYLFFAFLAKVINLYNKFFGPVPVKKIPSKTPIFTYIDRDFFDLFPSCASYSSLNHKWAVIYGTPLIIGSSLTDPLNLIEMQETLDRMGNNDFSHSDMHMHETNFDHNDHNNGF